MTTSGPENRLLAHLARLVHAHKPLKSKPHHDLGSIMDDTLRIAAGAMQLAHHRSSTLEALRSGTIGHVMLKQIRDAEVPERAALQQIIEAESQVKGDQPWHVWRLRKSTLTIAPGPGADLMATLGITSGQKVHGFGTRLGFTLGAGRIVWPPPG